MTNWHRNVYDGMTVMPEVGEGQLLALAGDGAVLPEPYAGRAQWVESVGLDGSIPRRGVLVLDAGDDGSALKGVAGVALYKPITGKFV